MVLVLLDLWDRLTENQNVLVPTSQLDSLRETHEIVIIEINNDGKSALICPRSSYIQETI